MRVLITSIGTATSVGLVKYFRKEVKDVVLVGVDVNPFGLTAGSQLVDRFYTVSYAAQNDYIYDLIRIVEDERIDLLIPINDIEIEVVARYRNQLPSQCKCFIPDESVIRLCRDKLAATRLVASLSVTCPELLEVNSNGPRVYRTNVSVGSKGVALLEDGDRLTRDQIASIQSGKAFLQRRVKGVEFTVDALCDKNGSLLYAIPRERLEVKSGVATKVAIRNNREMILAVQKITKKLCLPSFSNIQFIQLAGQAPFFIEINPRFGGCSIASLMAAPDMFRLYLDVLNGNYVTDHKLNDGVMWDSVITRYYSEVLYAQ